MILQAVCLDFVHIPDIGPISVQIIYKKKSFNAVTLIWRLSLTKSHTNISRVKKSKS